MALPSLLSIPFYPNTWDGSQCMQVTMKCVIEYFLHRDISLEELDRLTGRKQHLWTRTSQAVTVLYDLWLELKYYSSCDLVPFLEGEPYIRRHFGDDAEKILKHTDLPIVLQSIEHLLNYNLFEIKVPPLHEIEDDITQGHVPIALIDHHQISWAKGSYQWHFIVVTGFDDEYIFYHESWPSEILPNKKIPKTTFLDARNANGTDNDLVVVYGKR